MTDTTQHIQVLLFYSIVKREKPICTMVNVQLLPVVFWVVEHVLCSLPVVGAGRAVHSEVVSSLGPRLPVLRQLPDITHLTVRLIIHLT